LSWAARTRINETAVIDSTGIFWMEFLGSNSAVVCSKIRLVSELVGR
jgi:hypothetical protein